MKINIEQNLQTSSDLFFTHEERVNITINSITVPIYQREYDWDSDQIERLLIDLDIFANEAENNENNELYFAGAVILEKSDNYPKEFEVVDGQQRLTTLFLLNFLNYIVIRYRYEKPDLIGLSKKNQERKMLTLEQKLIIGGKRLCYGTFDDSSYNNNDEDDSLREDVIKRNSGSYLVDYPDERKLKFEVSDKDLNNKLKEVIKETRIIEENDTLTIKVPNIDNRYAENLNIIFEFFKGLFSGDKISNDAILEATHDRIENFIKYAGVALIISDNKDDSFKLFEVLNDTARKLTVLDLLKNYFVEKLGEDYSNENWNKLKEKEKSIKGGISLINDFIKSEGYAKSSNEYSYLSNRIAERKAFYKEEKPIDYFRRLFNLTTNLSSISEINFFNKGLQINSLSWNLSGINSLKFHWGREVMLSIFHISYLLKKCDIVELGIWKDIDHNKIHNLNNEDKLYIIVSDLLLKIGIIGKVNNLSPKVLPETAKSILSKFHDLLKSNNYKEPQNLELFIKDVKNLTLDYFEKQKNNFNKNLDFLNYSNNTHKNTIKFLLIILYNKGENVQYAMNNMSLEHIEPIVSRGQGYFSHEDRQSIVDGFGNIILIGQSKNSSFSNASVKEKLDQANNDIYRQDAFITHPIFASLDHNNDIGRGSFSEENFNLLRDENIYNNNVPTEKFFKNRLEFYKKELSEMIFKHDRFLLTNLPYEK